MSDDSLFGGLKQQLGDYASTLGRKALSSAGDQVDRIADRLEGGGGSASEAAKAGAEEIAEGRSPAKAAMSAATAGAKDTIKGVFGGGSGGSGGGSGDFKFSNIVETADVGVPLSVAYNAFTMFEDWPDFMKKVENVERTDDVKLSVKGQAVFSHRTWEATITEQVPDSHIVWESTGEKGHISGSVSFHALAPRLTRIIAIGEYRKQGFVEGIGALWFTVPRRFRLELKFFVHHVMTETILDQDGVEGWRGVIRDGELVTSHEEALEEEKAQAEEQEQPDEEQPAEGEAVQEEDSADDEAPDDWEEPADDEAEEPVEDELEPVEDYAEGYEEGEAPADDEEYIDDGEVGEEPEAAEPEYADDQEEPAEYEESTEEEADRR